MRLIFKTFPTVSMKNLTLLPLPVKLTVQRIDGSGEFPKRTQIVIGAGHAAACALNSRR